MPEDLIPATNIYDMRLTVHEDGWIYGLFCAERHDGTSDLSSATATAAIARTKDLKNWERLRIYGLKVNSVMWFCIRNL